MFRERPATTSLASSCTTRPSSRTVLAVLDKMGHRVPDDVSVIALCPTRHGGEPARTARRASTWLPRSSVRPQSRWCFASSAATPPPRPGWSRRARRARQHGRTAHERDRGTGRMKFNDGYWLLRRALPRPMRRRHSMSRPPRARCRSRHWRGASNTAARI